jgi:hypothetical protein
MFRPLSEPAQLRQEGGNLRLRPAAEEIPHDQEFVGPHGVDDGLSGFGQLDNGAPRIRLAGGAARKTCLHHLAHHPAGARGVDIEPLGHGRHHGLAAITRAELAHRRIDGDQHVELGHVDADLEIEQRALPQFALHRSPPPGL